CHVGAADERTGGGADAAQRTARRRPGHRHDAEICPGRCPDRSHQPVHCTLRQPMRRPTSLLLGPVVVAGALAVGIPSSGRAEAKPRGATILDAPAAGPSTSPPPPAEAPAPLPTPGAPASLPDGRTPAQPGTGLPTVSTKAANAAGLSLEMT